MFSRSLILLISLMLLQCIENPLTMRNDGSETGNGNKIIGVVLDENGLPSQNAVIQVFEVSSNSSSAIAEGLTNEKGEFLIKNIPGGVYNLEASQVNPIKMVRVSEVEILSSVSTVQYSKLILKDPGTIRLLDVEEDIQNGDEVYIPGSSMRWIIGPDLNTNHSFLLKKVFPGEYEQMKISLEDGAGERILAASVSVSSGDTSTLIPFNIQKKSWLYDVDLTSLGLSQNIVDYPLLLEVSETNVPLENRGGSEPAFKISDGYGDSLSYEIEYWDSVLNSGSIWVLIDTLFVDGSRFPLVLTWDSIPPSQETKDVFSSARFNNIWHFSKIQTDPDFQVIESVNNRGNGVLVTDGNIPSSVPGLIGLGLEFNDINHEIRTIEVDTNPNVFSVSLWFRTLSGNSGKLIEFGGVNGYDRHIWMDINGKIKMGIYEDSTMIDNRTIMETSFLKIVESQGAYNDGQWHYVVGSFSPYKLELYLDGERVAIDTTMAFASNHYSYWKVGGGTIGVWDPDLLVQGNFEGDVDEFRLQYQALGADEIRLNFALQKPGRNLISVK